MFYHSKNKTLSFRGIKIDYIHFGKGVKPLILIPGLSIERLRGKAFQMAYFYRLFAKDYQVFLFDRKDEVSEGYTISDMAEEVAQAMSVLHIENADVVGVSQGGMIAQILAVNYPSLVNKLVLGVTTMKANDTVYQTIGNWIELAENRDRKKMVVDMMEKVYSETYISHHRDLIWLMSKFMKVKELDRFIILASSILKFDNSLDVPRIKCPVFVIGGKEDKVVGGESSLELADKLNCDYFIYEKLGHSAYIEAKDFNKRILHFLSS